MIGSSHGYRLYMRSPEWAAKREEALRRAEYRCQGCRSDERLEVHHLTYERFGHERPTDLQVLCHYCHMREHGRSAMSGPVAGITVDEITADARLRDQQRGVLRQAALRALPLSVRLRRLEHAHARGEIDISSELHVIRQRLAKLRRATMEHSL